MGSKRSEKSKLGVIVMKLGKGLGGMSKIKKKEVRK